MSFAPIYDKDGNQITPEEHLGIPDYDPRTQSLITGRPRDLSEAGFGGRLSGFIRGLIEAQNNPDYEPTSRIGQLLAALAGNLNQTPDRSDVIIDDTPSAPLGNAVRNETERSAVRGAFEGMASELGMSGPEFWNLVSDANLEVRNGRASSALDIVAARLGLDEDTLIDKGLQHGFTMENGQIRVSDKALGRNEQDVWRDEVHGPRGYRPNAATPDVWRFDEHGPRGPRAWQPSDLSLMEGNHRGADQQTVWREGDEHKNGGNYQTIWREGDEKFVKSEFAIAPIQSRMEPMAEVLKSFEPPAWAGAHQGRHDDPEPQGNRVTASGQEATVVAQR